MESVCKDEDIRKLKFQQCLLEDEIDDLHNQLEQEVDRSDNLERELEEAHARSEELDAEIVRVTNDLKIRTRELETTRVCIGL